MNSLSGRVGVVTGASGGIGSAIAVALADLGASVYAVGRRACALEALAGRVRPGGHPVVVHPADVTRDEDVVRLVDRVDRDEGRLDFLVHGAGVIATGTLELAPTTTLDVQYRVNVRAPYLVTQAFLPLLKATRGDIVFIASTAAFRVRRGLGQYAATKHALRAVADALREEVNEAGVRVLSVYPGRTATPLQASIHAEEGRAYRPGLLLQPGDIAAIVVATLRLPRTAEVTDITIRPFAKTY